MAAWKVKLFKKLIDNPKQHTCKPLWISEFCSMPSRQPRVYITSSKDVKGALAVGIVSKENNAAENAEVTTNAVR